MVNGIRTRAGIAPSNKALPFSVTTSDVEEYLQKRVDATVKQLNGKVERCEVNVCSTEAGKYFIPFMVVLPMSVLKNQQKQRNDDVEYIFNQKNEDPNALINDVYYRLFSSYTYDGRDEKSFLSDNWRRQLGIYSSKTSYVLANLRTPKVTKIGNDKHIMFLIDPLRIFHDMVTSDDDKRNFNIEITRINKVETGKYRYDFKRVIIENKHKKYNMTISEAVNHRLRGH